MLSLTSLTASTATKAKIASYGLIRCLRHFQCHDINIFSALFNSKIQPILLYGSEFWGAYESVEVERVHTFAFKRFLSVSLYASNKLLYKETGRYPLHIVSKINVIRYWFKLLKLPMSRLCKQSYQSLLNHHSNGHANWASEVQNILCKNGFGIVWMSQSVGCEKTFLKTFRERLKDNFLQNIDSALQQNETGYNANYMFTNIFQPETYLHNKLFKSYRDILVKFKLKVSPIYVHSKKFTPNANILCPLCKQNDETEIHFVFDCSILEVLRKTFLPPHILFNRNLQNFHTIMSHEYYTFDIAKYLYNAFKVRKSLLG